MLKGILLKTNNECEVIEYENDLDALQNIVDGYIEYVYLQNNMCMIINEEGKLRGMEYNELATRLIPFQDFIVGNALIVGTKDGENISLSDSEIEILLSKIKGSE